MLRNLASLALLTFLFLPTSLFAQVAIELSVVETYDDNIFLEDEGGIVLPEGIDFSALGNGEDGFVIPEEADNKENDDFITFLGLGLSGQVPLSRHLDTRASVNGGVFLFADQSSENRFSINSAVTISPEETILPSPFIFSISDTIITSAQDVESVDSSVASSTTSHNIGVNFGVSSIEVVPLVSTGLTYSVGRTDHLGSLTIDDENEEAEEALGLTDEGSDFFLHSVNSNTTYNVAQNTDANLSLVGTYTDFTNIESNDLVDSDEDDQDRYGLALRVGVDHRPTEALVLDAGAGFSYTKYREDRSPRVTTIINEDGVSESLSFNVDDDSNDFIFDLGATYSFDVSTALSAGVSQTTGSNIDGDRVVRRNLNGNFSKHFNDKLSFGLGGEFHEFSSEDGLSNATEQFSATASLRYQVATYAALTAAYSYSRQDAPQNVASAIINRSSDYTSNQVFLSLSVGVVGLPDEGL